MIGQRSDDNPSNVSTPLKGDSDIEVFEEGYGNGAAVGGDEAFGEVPSERAAMTS